MRSWRVSQEGCSRFVVVTPVGAFKFPRIRYGWKMFLIGLLCNITEMQTWRGTRSEGLCPVTDAVPGGWLIVMRPAAPVPPERSDEVPARGVGYDDKLENYGVIDGRVVRIDYGGWFR